MLLSAVSILARTSASSTTSGLVTSCAVALAAFISYQRWSLRVAAELGRLHGDLGSRDHELAGVDRQPHQDLQRVDPAHQDRGAEDEQRSTIGIAARSSRTRRLWRAACANARVMSRRSPTAKPWLPDLQAWRWWTGCRPRDAEMSKAPRYRPYGDFISRFNGLKIRCEYGPVGAKFVTNGRKCPRPPSRPGRAGPDRAGT